MFKEFISEAKKATANTYLRIALAAVMLVPLFYGALYLKAFWDPYAKMDQVAVAIVNLDKGYNEGTSKINVGDELVSSLKSDDHLKWVFVSATDAEKGMNEKNYYASLTVPADFSAKIYSVDGANPTSASLTYRSREATNYLATTITSSVSSKVTDTLSHKITKKYLDNIFVNLKSTATDLTKAKDASIQLASGLNTASQGSGILYNGLVSAGQGSEQLISGLNTLTSGQNSLTSGLTTAVSGANQLKTGAESVSVGITQGQAALNAYIATNPAAAENPYIKGLSGALTASKAGQAQVISGLGSMSTQLDVAKNGSNELVNGSVKLSAGASELSGGITKLSNGASELTAGLTEAKNGSSELATKLTEGADKAVTSTEAKKVAAQTAVIASPVSMTTNSYDLVANYGSGFAPYFISLALWVGGLLSFFVIDFTKKPKDKKTAMFKYIILGILGSAQAILLGLVLEHSLGLVVTNQWQFYGFITLMSLTFMAIIQLLVQHLDNIGRYIAILLLILQLASAAGTFPKETLPSFFQIISPVLPMTYSVLGLRDILFTHELSNLWMPLIYFVAILIVCILANFFLTKNTAKKG